MDRRQQKMGSSKFQEIRNIAENAEDTCATTLARLGACRTDSEVKTRATIQALLPFNDDEALLAFIDAPGARGEENRTNLSSFILAKTRCKDLATKGLAALLSPRYLANHIWDSHKCR